MKTVLVVLGTLSAAFSVPLVGQDDEYSRKTLAGLNGAAVLIEQIRDDAQHDGLWTGQVQTDVELRLRQAGIPVLTEEQMLAAPGSPYLYVNINTYKSESGL